MKRNLLLAAFALGALTAQAQTVETLIGDLTEPYGVAVDLERNVYFFTSSASDRVYRFDPASRAPMTVFAEYGIDVNPQGVAASSGEVVVALSGSHRIERLKADGTTVVIGDGQRGSDNGSAAGASFNYPYGVALDRAGVIYVADTFNNIVRKIAADNTVTTFATGFNRPMGIAVSNDGSRIVVADTFNSRVVTLDASGAQVSSTPVTGPRGVAWVGGSTGLVIADTDTHTIRRGGGQLLAGVRSAAGYNDSDFDAALFNTPTGVAVDADGSILVADLKNGVIRKLLREAATTPELSHEPGTYADNITLTVVNPIFPENTVFRYTLNGKDPNPFSPAVDSGIALAARGSNTNAIVKVRGFSPDAGSTVILSNVYNFAVAPLALLSGDQVATGGTFDNDQPLRAETGTPGASIRYTIANTPPSSATDGAAWVDADFGRTGKLQLRAFRDGFTPSTVVSNTYTFNVGLPWVSPAGGTFTNDVQLVVTNSTKGSALRYTVDGSDVTTATATTIANNTPMALNGNAAGQAQLVFKVRGTKDGYNSSEQVNATFKFQVAPLSISVPGGTFDRPTNVVVATATTGAVIRYRVASLDEETPTPPTESDPVWENGAYARTGILLLRGFRSGYTPTETVSAEFQFQVVTPTITTPGSTFNNSQQIAFAGSTPGTVFRYTLDGTEPTATSTEAVNGSFTLDGNAPGASNVVVTVKGFRDGFLPSAGSSKETYWFEVAAPQLRAPASADGVYLKEVKVTASNGTTGAINRVTADGTLPNGSSVAFPAELVVTNMKPVIVVGTKANYNSSLVVSNTYLIKVEAPQLSDTIGFFPSGTTVTASVSRPDAFLKYTVDGTDPTEESIPAAKSNTLAINVDTLQFESADLRFLKVRAFADDLLPSDVVSGGVMSENSIGIPKDINAGSGATVVLPVVVNLKRDQILRSLQFNVEVSPTAGGKPPVPYFQSLSFGTNDYVLIKDGHITADAYEFRSFSATAAGPAGQVTNILRVSILDTANFGIQNYGLVAMVAIRIPPSAVNGDTYSVKVTQASGTEDGNQRSVTLTSLPTKLLNVATRRYLVGDTAPGIWYNAGEFGDGVLDNSDVLNAFRASVDLRVPYQFGGSHSSDAFNAMDVYPEDSEDSAGGDGVIDFTDWQLLLERSLMGQAGWFRYWTNGGLRTNVVADSTAASGLSAASEATTRPGAVWVREGLILAGTVENAQPGQSVSVPVYVRPADGAHISGLQFRATVIADAGAPALDARVQFVRAAGVPAERTLSAELPANSVVAAWDIGSFEPELTSRTLLGHLRFTIPAGAQTRDCYRIRFVGVGGSPEPLAGYRFESRAACVWVQVPNTEPREVISDEWRKHFFERIDAITGAAEADPDNDGVPNWKEFLAGTHPLQQGSRLALHSPEARGAGAIALRFLSAPGKQYVIESAASLEGPWAVVINGVIGDGSLMELLDSKPARQGRFYRIRLVEPAE